MPNNLRKNRLTVFFALALILSGCATVYNPATQRNDELFADKLAVRYSRRAGFSPYAIVTFFQKLKDESKKKGALVPPVFLSSHPAIDERIKKIEEEIAAIP